MVKMIQYVLASILACMLGSAFAATGASLTLTTLTTTLSRISTGETISFSETPFNRTILQDRGTISFPSGGRLPSVSLSPDQIVTYSIGYNMAAFDDGYSLNQDFVYVEGVRVSLALHGFREGAFVDLILGDCDGRTVPYPVVYGCGRRNIQTIQDNKPDSLSSSGVLSTTYSLANGVQSGLVNAQYFYFVQATPNGIPPIPEPSAYALLLAGLTVVGLRARRQRPTRTQKKARGRGQEAKWSLEL